MPERIYVNRIPGEERIHIEFPAHEIADILDDFTPADDAYDATKQLRRVLEKAAADLNLTYTHANMPPQQPHETGQAAPHGSHGPSGAPMGPATSERIGDGRTAVRVFWLQRDHDVSGVSGTGTVADGVLWPDGAVTIRWRGPRPSTVNWQSLDDAEHVHGHGGATRIVWADEPPTHRCACGIDWPDLSLGCGHTFTRCESVEGAGMFDPNAIVAPDNMPCTPGCTEGHTYNAECEARPDSQDTGLDDALREQYAAAVDRLRENGGVYDIDDAERDRLIEAVLAVRDRRMAQLAAGRQTWKTKAEEMERDRDRSDDAVRRILDQRQELAAERYAWQERALRAEATVARVRAECDAIARDVHGKNPVALAGYREANARIRAALDAPAAEQPAPTTYAEAQQQHIQLLRRRHAARQAMDTAWDRLEEQAIHDLVRLASTDDTALEARP